ncbi:ATP-binding protein [Salinispirillum sp. LH 10-3-1]|uniref:histidine kinase n=1 Tax=Salinispirillum sp. LH 10-3-1 TaxID=2952525 RepID=A0AB38YES8_9GAMM
MSPSSILSLSLPADLLLLRVLYALRGFAVVGQTIAILVATYVFNMTLPLTALWLGVGALLLFNLVLFWWVFNTRKVTQWQWVGHIGIDLLVLTWQLFWTGGSTNPFVSLYLLPVALVALALPVRAVIMVGIATSVSYSLLMLFHKPLLMSASMLSPGMQLHVLGMWVNFLLTVALLTAFGSWMSHNLRLQRDKLQQARAKAMRNQSILGIAAHSAQAAHELNTPLSTLKMIAAEMKSRADEFPADLRDDIDTLDQQLDFCRDSVQRMVKGARAAAEHNTRKVSSLFRETLARFRLLRPEIELDTTLPDLTGTTVQEALAWQHLLLTLLDNAADASLAQGHKHIALNVTRHGQQLTIAVTDHGQGEPSLTGVALHSTKTHGFGIGLALADLTLEASGNQLTIETLPQGHVAYVEMPLREEPL